jgi:hypothetical protein
VPAGHGSGTLLRQHPCAAPFLFPKALYPRAGCPPAPKSKTTPYLYGNLADDWLDPLLAKLGLYESGMGWHSFKRFRNTWPRKQLVQEDIRLHWLAHQLKEMSEVYCMLKEDLPARLAEAERVGCGFSLPKEYVPSVPRKGLFVVSRKVPATGILVNRMKETGGV